MRIPSGRLTRVPLVLLGLSLAAACSDSGGRGSCSGEYCGTLVFVATGQPDILLPPVATAVLSRDIFDQLFLKLADIGLAVNTVGDAGFEPRLAERWEWDDPRTLVFHIDPRARWHDGRPVTAADVAFTFDAYNDPKVNSSSRAALQSISAVTERDSLTTVFRFRTRYPEMFYDAVYHMRILPAHILREVPRDQWATAAFGRAPVGNGPYKFVEWKAGERVELVADSTFYLGRPHIRRLIWRMTPEIEVAMTQLLAGEADAFEFVWPPPNIERVSQSKNLTIYPYQGAVYSYLAFNMTANGDTTVPHPIFGDREVRRALSMALDRQKLLQSVFGDFAKVPPGPISPIWTALWDTTVRVPAYDSLRAARLLAQRGWRDTDGDGVRDKDGVPLAFRILVLSTSGARRRYGQLIQEQLRPLGVKVELDEVDNAVLNERGKAGQFDAALASWQTDPTPSSGLAQTWTRQGFGGGNWGRYDNPLFQAALERASTHLGTPAEGRRLWRAAIQLIVDDAPGIWLYAPQNHAAVSSRVADVRIHPDSWWALVQSWRIPPDRQIDRDRVER
jgi:peptide/nickel transport system substrate-binding protein